jgi:two-component system, NtrC family, response regulator GlrR
MSQPKGPATLVIPTRAGRRVMTYRLDIESPAGPLSRDVAQLNLRVGSQAGNDLVIEDPTLSRIHFEIDVDDLGFHLRDLGSKNGTFVDGYRTADMVLKPSCRILAGETLFTFSAKAEHTELPLFEAERFGPLLGRSVQARSLFAMLERVAAADATVLLEGESGTGKELCAAAIHAHSPRHQGPFVTFDCAATPANLLESSLFGHEKGAFTGAHQLHVGYMEEATGGTLFLDEIGELPLDLQPKLLRALESRSIRRLGSTKTIDLDLRIVAASNRDLAREVNSGGFREDLYYRLAVVRLRVPPLRERLEDVPLLVDHFVRQLCPTGTTPEEVLGRVTPASHIALRTHPWGGNIRELRNVVERALALAGPGDITIEPGVGQSPAVAGSSVAPPAVTVDLERPFSAQKAELIAAFEDTYLRGILDKHEGNISRAAEAAGMDRMYFKRMLKKNRD